MNGTFSTAHISPIRRAMRLTNFSDSITQGPRMKAGILPPRVTLPIVRRLSLTAIVHFPLFVESEIFMNASCDPGYIFAKDLFRDAQADQSRCRLDDLPAGSRSP